MWTAVVGRSDFSHTVGAVWLPDALPGSPGRCNVQGAMLTRELRELCNSYQLLMCTGHVSSRVRPCLGWVPATTVGPNQVELNTPGHVWCLGEESSNGDACSGKGKGPGLALSLIPDSTRRER